MNWDQRYQGEEYLFGTAPNDFLAEIISQVPKGETLCLADGEGRNGVFLAKQGYEVTSVDASRVGLVKARALAESQGTWITTLEADLFRHDMGERCWDLIVSIFFHMPPDRRVEVHRKIVSALRPGGWLILEAYTPEQLTYGTGGPPVAEFLMTPEILAEDFSELEFIHCEQKIRDVVEGSGHTGQASVVQLLARKPLTSD
ncbi:MAG: methyltransferase domain-containing protein [Pseudomonadales bacterium]|nr:methyltransferase domain-containing protein [Pseudomonadales bacterium]